jgi:hypothetical protein
LELRLSASLEKIAASANASVAMMPKTRVAGSHFASRAVKPPAPPHPDTRAPAT